MSSRRGGDGEPGRFAYHSIARVPIGTTEAQSVVVGDKLYLFGGFDTLKTTLHADRPGLVVRPAANHWTALPSMPVHGITHAGIATDGDALRSGTRAAPGRRVGHDQVFGTTDGCRYDIATGTYTALPSLPVARMGGGLGLRRRPALLLRRQRPDPYARLADIWMLDVAAGATTWVSRAPMPDPRNHLGWGVIDGTMYAVGGQHLGQSWTAQGELDRYDPATDTWTTLAPLPAPRAHLMDSTFVLDGHLVAAGGWTTVGRRPRGGGLRPGDQHLASGRRLPEARTSTTVKSLSGGRILFCCGSAGTSNATGLARRPGRRDLRRPRPPTSAHTSPDDVTADSRR